MKAQFLSFDAIFAVIIFSFAITILAFVWYNISSQLSIAYGAGPLEMQSQLQYLIENLLSQGNPSSWNSQINTTNIATWSHPALISQGLGAGEISIGIGTGVGNNVDPTKLATFIAMANSNYQATKSLLGIGFDYYIIFRFNGYTVPVGLNPNTNGAVAIQVANKAVTVNGQNVNMQIMVWTNSTFGIG